MLQGFPGPALDLLRPRFPCLMSWSSCPECRTWCGWPFTGHLIDDAGKNALAIVGEQFRFLIFGSTVGTILGIILLPSFVALFSRAIIHLAGGGGSVFQVFRKGFSKQGFKNALSYLRLPSISYVKGFHMRLIPKRLFVINMLITSIYTIGVLSALYAGLLAPERSTTAVMASGLINGIATILLAILLILKYLF